MRRLGRWTISAATVLSLLLCVATVGLWARSYRHRIAIYWSAGEMPRDGQAIWEHSRSLSMNRGVLAANSTYQQWPAGSFWSGPAPEGHRLEYGETDAYPDEWLDDDRYDHDPTIRTLRFAGFELAYPRRATVADARHDSNGSLLLPYVLVTPAWTVALLFALLPTLRLAGWWRKRPRFGAGRCSACSYDLAGNVSGVCPECGTPVAAHPSEAPPCP